MNAYFETVRDGFIAVKIVSVTKGDYGIKIRMKVLRSKAGYKAGYKAGEIIESTNLHVFPKENIRRTKYSTYVRPYDWTKHLTELSPNPRRKITRAKRNPIEWPKAIQYFDTVKTEKEAREQLVGLRHQIDFLGGRVIPPSPEKPGWHIQALFEPVEHNYPLPDGMRRVIVPPGLVKELGLKVAVK